MHSKDDILKAIGFCAEAERYENRGFCAGRECPYFIEQCHALSCRGALLKDAAKVIKQQDEQEGTQDDEA